MFYVMWLLIIIIILSIGIIFFLFHRFWFLRNPIRKIPQDDVIVSPADGKVIAVQKIKELDKLKIKKGLVGKILTSAKDVDIRGYLVSIFMSPFDVHYIRMPYDGTVLSVKHEKGKFVAANSLDAFKNEKTEILIKTSLGKIKVIMIAGFLARRTIPLVKKNDKLLKGQHIGLINLGSQVSMILPGKIKPLLKKGRRIKAGESIIARIR